MSALDNYVKKNGKAHPYKGKTKAKGTTKGPDGIEDKSQYAKESSKSTSGSDAKDDAETKPTGIDAYQSVRGFAGKKNKQRSYLD